MRRIIPTLLLLSSAACAVGTVPDEHEHEATPQEHLQGMLDAYDRASGPTACATGEDAVNGKCYTPCKTGYAAIPADPMFCATTCPSGYTDEGDSCFREPKTVAANMNGCFSSLSCGENLLLGCMACPSGYEAIDNCQCWLPPDTITKTTYDRSDTGKAFDACATGSDQDGTLCLAACKTGFHAVGPMCLKD
jgi:hypothetical protein